MFMYLFLLYIDIGYNICRLLRFEGEGSFSLCIITFVDGIWLEPLTFCKLAESLGMKELYKISKGSETGDFNICYTNHFVPKMLLVLECFKSWH
jgi:hypothetical protein